jgi:hypothetical protein
MNNMESRDSGEDASSSTTPWSKATTCTSCHQKVRPFSPIGGTENLSSLTNIVDRRPSVPEGTPVSIAAKQSPIAYMTGR